MNVATHTAAEEKKKENWTSSKWPIFPAVLRRDISAVCYHDKGQTAAGSLAAVDRPVLDGSAL